MPLGWEGFWSDLPAFFDEVVDLGIRSTTGLILTLSIPLVFLAEKQGVISDWIRRQSWALRWPLYYALALAILFFGSFGQSAFIYQHY